MLSAQSMKPLYAALGRIPSGLFVITARRENTETGMLASWVQQCSFEPPQITLAVRQDRYLTEWLADGTPFIINILEDCQTDMVAHFGKGFEPGENAFSELLIQRIDGFPPILSEAAAYLGCKIVSRSQPGDHVLFIGEVVTGNLLSEGHPMIHVRKSGIHY